MIYPNQKIIKLNITREFTDNSSIKINEDIISNAIKEFSPVELKLYLYFMLYKKDVIIFSSKKASEKINATVLSVQKGINRLKEKGYLQQVNGNHYIFHEKPVNPIDLP